MGSPEMKTARHGPIGTAALAVITVLVGRNMPTVVRGDDRDLRRRKSAQGGASTAVKPRHSRAAITDSGQVTRRRTRASPQAASSAGRTSATGSRPVSAAQRATADQLAR